MVKKLFVFLTQLRNFQGQELLEGDIESHWYKLIERPLKLTEDIDQIKFQVSISKGLRGVAVTSNITKEVITLQLYQGVG